MRLLLVELDRFRSRRAVALLVLAAALLTALMAATTVWSTRPVGAAELARAQAQAQQEASSPQFQRQLRRCEQHPARYLGPEASAEQCAESMTPRADWYLDRSRLDLESVQHDTGTGALVIVGALMVIVGTTFAGADWASGSMSNQLLFEPRRWKVWAAKGAAVLVGTLVTAAVILTAFWAVMFLTAAARGIDTGAQLQESIRWMVARGVLLAALGGLGGYALTMLLRHTVGTVAALFAYAVGGTALLAALPVAGVGRWSVGNNVMAWIDDGYDYFDASVCRAGGGACGQSVHLTLGQSVTYLGAVLVVVMVLSALSFRRRDIP